MCVLTKLLFLLKKQWVFPFCFLQNFPKTECMSHYQSRLQWLIEMHPILLPLRPPAGFLNGVERQFQGYWNPMKVQRKQWLHTLLVLRHRNTWVCFLDWSALFSLLPTLNVTLWFASICFLFFPGCQPATETAIGLFITDWPQRWIFHKRSVSFLLLLRPPSQRTPMLIRVPLTF